MHLSRVQNPNCISEGSILELNFNCVFTCPQGYIFEKAKVRTVTRYCTDSETWSGEDDVCIGLLLNCYCYERKNCKFCQ